MISTKTALLTIGGLLLLVVTRLAAFHFGAVPVIESVRDTGAALESPEFGLLGGYEAAYLDQGDAIRILPLTSWLYALEVTAAVWLLVGFFVALAKPTLGMRLVGPAPLLTFPFLVYVIPKVGPGLFLYYYFFTAPDITSMLAPFIWAASYFTAKD